MDTKNLSIIRQSFANTVFTHKVQEVASENQDSMVNLIKISNIILVSLVLLTLVFQSFFMKIVLFSYIGAGLTVGEIIFLIIQLTFNFEQKSILHKNTALKLLGLRDKYRSLITDIMNESINTQTIIERRNTLQEQYQVICDLSPQTNKEDYNKAQEKLNKRGVVGGEEFTWSDEEIDWFLPENLRFKTYEKRQ